MDAKKTEITFTIAPDGTVSFEVEGVKGPDCLELTKGIEEELGVVTARDKTSEYYEVEEVAEQTVSLDDGSGGDGR
jgi:hypothetical protein